ncbi:molybdenum cofactor biosynthesis protein 1-like protein [Dinothrombium tinctorium]|nr:molybdenum cofactor biosynthesis protein 1-like protein [Dinothrombium tinctorium]
MVDISHKTATQRVAIAKGRIYLGTKICELIERKEATKGDVITTAKIAGIMAAKNTCSLIPLCHQIALSNVHIEIEIDHKSQEAIISARVSTLSSTGVEMEALTAVSVTTLTIYDMCKAVSKNMIIKEIKLQSKSGGKSGDVHYD